MIAAERKGNALHRFTFEGKINMNKRIIFFVTTMFIMIIASRFLIRIVDATVQIDDDIGYLVILLVLLNTAIGMAGCRLYQKTSPDRKNHE